MPELASKCQCTGCTACANSCPRQCIQMKKDSAGFFYPEIVKPSACIDCGACERACPVLADNKVTGNHSLAFAYAAFAKNEPLRMESSSGGVFSELATVILQMGGIVYGSSYDENGVIRHIGSENKQDLGKLRGAKYSQSVLGNTFSNIKKQLMSGKTVLFSGTPCQVAGLKSFLKRDYDNLVCIDFVCHGVPSPMVWEKYVAYRAQFDNGGTLPLHINLRNKESGWSNYSYSVEFAYGNKKRYFCKNAEDPFMYLFVNDYILRKSCGDCHFKGYNRVSDITLGDFWGIQNIDPEMDDNKGTSLVLTHDAVGEDLLKKVAGRVKIKQVTLEQASSENLSLLKSSVHKPSRDIVLKTIESEDFQAILPFLQKEQLLQRRKRENILKKVLKKLRGL